MRVINIELSGINFVFRVGDNDWCRAELHKDENQFKPGAEKWGILKDRLFNALSNPGNSIELEWMLTLTEEHCSLYRQNIVAKNFFVFQDAQAKPFWHLELLDPLNEKELGIV